MTIKSIKKDCTYIEADCQRKLYCSNESLDVCQKSLWAWPSWKIPALFWEAEQNPCQDGRFLWKEPLPRSPLVFLEGWWWWRFDMISFERCVGGNTHTWMERKERRDGSHLASQAERKRERDALSLSLREPRAERNAYLTGLPDLYKVKKKTCL